MEGEEQEARTKVWRWIREGVTPSPLLHFLSRFFDGRRRAETSPLLTPAEPLLTPPHSPKLPLSSDPPLSFPSPKVLSDDVNTGYQLFQNLQVLRVNGTEVLNLSHLRR